MAFTTFEVIRRINSCKLEMLLMVVIGFQTVSSSGRKYAPEERPKEDNKV
jgi:hypothetical protein